MDKDRDSQSGNDVNERRQPNVLPATEVVKNPNPRANGNLVDKNPEEISQNDELPGSEITDGEAG